MLRSPFLIGVREALPLLGGYIPVAISFGLIAVQAGFSVWAAVMISLIVYAGSSQFVFVAMIASGAPLWLAVLMTILVNARHMVYGPNLAQWLPRSRWMPVLMHGLTDQIFALALTRLPQLERAQRLAWYTGAMLLAWTSWVAGTAIGALAGDELLARWPLVGEVLPFALPALFLALLAPRFNHPPWAIALCFSSGLAVFLKLGGLPNAAIPLAAAAGAVVLTVTEQTRIRASR